MFKSVEYVGFENGAELILLVRRLMPVLEDEIRNWKDDITVRWCSETQATSSGVRLDLTLTLNDITVSASRLISNHDLRDDAEARYQIRQVWDSVMEQYLEKNLQRLRESLLEPVEI